MRGPRPARVPLRVDFAGGWLDVPRLARPDGYVVNCAIQPLVALDDWPYEVASGLGGSAARFILEGRDGVREELANGVGWQDPAIILKTGLCVWRSGPEPILDLQIDPNWLRGRLLLHWTGRARNCADYVDTPRDYESVAEASRVAKQAVERRNLTRLAEAVQLAYEAQLAEGMAPLPVFKGSLAMKYGGGGHGGYGIYLFRDRAARDSAHTGATKAVEPYVL